MPFPVSEYTAIFASWMLTQPSRPERASLGAVLARPLRTHDGWFDIILADIKWEHCFMIEAPPST